MKIKKNCLKFRCASDVTNIVPQWSDLSWYFDTEFMMFSWSLLVWLVLRFLHHYFDIQNTILLYFVVSIPLILQIHIAKDVITFAHSSRNTIICDDNLCDFYYRKNWMFFEKYKTTIQVFCSENKKLKLFSCSFAFFVVSYYYEFFFVCKIQKYILKYIL